MERDACEGSVIPFRDLDVIVRNDCILSAEEYNSNIGWIDDGIVLDHVPRAEERDAVRPAILITVVICECASRGMDMVAGRVDRHTADRPTRAEESQRRPAFDLLIDHIMDHDAGCPIRGIDLVILVDIVPVRPAFQCNATGRTPRISRHVAFRQPGSPVVAVTVKNVIWAGTNAHVTAAVHVNVAEIDTEGKQTIQIAEEIATIVNRGRTL